MVEMSRRQVTRAAAWSVPVITMAAAAPAAAASGGGSTCPACFQGPSRNFVDAGSWVLTPHDVLDPTAGSELSLSNNVHYGSCVGIPDGTVFEMSVSRLEVNSTDGPVTIDSSRAGYEGAKVPGYDYFELNLKFLSTAWSSTQSDTHHLVSVDADYLLNLTNVDTGYSASCPLSVSLTLGPNPTYGWSLDSGTSTVS